MSAAGTTLVDVTATLNPTTPGGGAPPELLEFPLGFLTFAVSDVAPAAATTVTLLLPPGTTYDTYLKYGPTPADPSPHWYEFLYDESTDTGAKFLSDRIELHFVDGGRGDDDLTANGVIVDPGAPAQRVIGARVYAGALQVVGTSESDNIVLGMVAGNQLIVIADFLPDGSHTMRFDAERVERIEVSAGNGHDHVVVAANVNVPVKLDGGAGDDNLKGGPGDDILLGGDGNDLLVGGAGRDVLIGSRGADRIVGNWDDDILIAGNTAHDVNTVALLAIMDEWTSDRDYTSRVDNLRGIGSGGLNQGYFLQTEGDTRTVYDDDARDTLTGGWGCDWFLANCFHDDESLQDRITDLSDSEFADDLDWIEQELIVADPAT